MPNPQWVSRYVGIPYEEADCYGLVRLVYREVFGLETPLLPAGEPSEGNGPKWVRSSNGAVGCVVALNINGNPAHCGIVVGIGQMLHAVRGQRSAVEHFDSSKWLKRFAGFYSLEVPGA